MKFPNVDDGSSASGLIKVRNPRIIPVTGLKIPNIAGNDCPIAANLTGLNLFPRAGVGKAWAEGMGNLIRATCPVVTTFPTITWTGIKDYYAAFDSESQLMYCGNQTSGNSIDVINTATQTKIATYVSSNGFVPFGAFCVLWDNLNKIVVIQSQFHGWGTFNPANLAFTQTLADTGTLSADAGNLIESAIDSATGICCFVAINSGGNGGIELIQHTSATTANILYNSGYTLAQLQETPAFSIWADKFLVIKLAGGFYYVDKHTGALTPSAIASTLGGRIFDIPGTRYAVTTNQSAGGAIAIIDVQADTITNTTRTPLSVINGAIYNSCQNRFIVTDNGGTYIFDGTTFAEISSTPTGGYGLYFDKYTNLTFRLGGANQVITL